MFSFECAAAAALYFFYRPPSFETKHSEDGKSPLRLLCELDYVGLFLLVGGLVLLLLGLNRVRRIGVLFPEGIALTTSKGGRDEPWKSAGVIAPIILSVPMFAVLVLWETYRPLKNPILPIHIFKKWRQ